MEKITRRLFMRKSAALPVGVVALPLLSSTTKASRYEPVEFAADRKKPGDLGYPPPTPLERFDDALRELKRAARALDPSIQDWYVRHAVSGDLDCRMIITAFREKLPD